MILGPCHSRQKVVFGDPLASPFLGMRTVLDVFNSISTLPKSKLFFSINSRNLEPKSKELSFTRYAVQG